MQGAEQTEGLGDQLQTTVKPIDKPRQCRHSKRRGQPLKLKLTNILWLGRRGPSAQLRLINTRRAIRTYDRTANGTSNMAWDTSLLLIESERASSNIRLTLYTTR